MKKDTNNISTAIIYTRVSSKEQLDGFSLETQERDCRSFAVKNNLTVLEVFKEEGESAKTADRTQLQRMLKYVEKNRGKIGKLIIHKVDRLSRKSLDYATIRFTLKKSGIDIVSASEAIENTPQGRFMEIILSGFAELDNDVRAQRTSGGMRTRAQNGLWTWGAPLGYKNTTDLIGNKIIEPHPEKSAWIKTIFEEYAKGIHSFRDIAKLVNKLGLKSKHDKRIAPQLIAKILKNPIYYGRIEVPSWDISVQGKHEPIISEELFSQVQRITNGGKSGTKKLPRNRDNPDFPLRGIQCSGCGHSLSGGWATGKTKRFAYYCCIYLECPKRKSIRKKELEDAFTELLTRLKMENKEVNILKESIKLAYKDETRSITSRNKKIDSEIGKLRNQQQSLWDLKLGNKEAVSDDEFREQKERIELKIQELDLSKELLVSVGLDIDSAIDFAFELIRDLPQNWQNLEVNELRVLRSILFPKNLVYMCPDIKTPELACIFKLKPSIEEEKERLVALRRIELLFSP